MSAFKTIVTVLQLLSGLSLSVIIIAQPGPKVKSFFKKIKKFFAPYIDPRRRSLAP